MSVEQRWHAIWLALLGHAAALVIFNWMFDHERLLVDSPTISLALGLVSAGLIAMLIPALINATTKASKERTQRVLIGILLGGTVFRLLMFWTVPAFETDFYRYLWDGALGATGHNPYLYVPGKIDAANVPQSVKDLAWEAGYVHERINHRELRTIYPPVAQFFFALAYLAETWSLTAWRLVCLLAEFATVGLLYLLLKDLGRSPLWIAVYWWNPLIIKELMNSAHMEAVLVPMLVGAMVLAIRQKLVGASILLSLAAGIKVWPLLLLPLVFRGLLSEPRRLVAAVASSGLIVLACALPPILSGLDQSSGFVAYASDWRRNGALFPVLQTIASVAFDAQTSSTLARALVAVTAGSFALFLAWQPVRSSTDLLRRMTFVALAVVLLSPAQYPWYIAWILPFMAVVPLNVTFLMAALMPIYYMSFYFREWDMEWLFQNVIVFVIWLPVWTVLAIELRSAINRQPDHPVPK